MQNKINQRQQLQRSSTFRVLTVIAGALLAAVGLELFLMPHTLLSAGLQAYPHYSLILLKCSLDCFYFYSICPLYLCRENK